MKEIQRFFNSGVFLSFISLNASASVQFITGKRNIEFGNVEFQDPTEEHCKKEGFSLTSCPSGQISGNVCPYNSSYFDKCCDRRYQYDKSDCVYPNYLKCPYDTSLVVCLDNESLKEKNYEKK